jgi:CDP-glucose 4,6-dehydratase
LFEAAGWVRACATSAATSAMRAVSPASWPTSADFVFHLAAQAIVSTSYADPLDTIATNVMGHGAVLDALRAVEQPCTTVIVTSDKAYENVEWPWGYRETDRLGRAGHLFGLQGRGGGDLPRLSAELLRQAGRAGAGGFGAGGQCDRRRRLGRGPDRGGLRRAWRDGRDVEIARPSDPPLAARAGAAQRLPGARRAAGARPALHGESFNLGPRGEQNATVRELLEDLARVWGLEDVSKAYRITGNIPFHEAGLLKLNIDKALLMLRWEPNLSYAECVEMTGGWYREVVRDGADAGQLTTAQIRAYEAFAEGRRRIWTQ